LVGILVHPEATPARPSLIVSVPRTGALCTVVVIAVIVARLLLLRALPDPVALPLLRLPLLNEIALDLLLPRCLDRALLVLRLKLLLLRLHLLLLARDICGDALLVLLLPLDRLLHLALLLGHLLLLFKEILLKARLLRRALLLLELFLLLLQLPLLLLLLAS
jgi:hypothetical protein